MVVGSSKQPLDKLLVGINICIDVHGVLCTGVDGNVMGGVVGIGVVGCFGKVGQHNPSQNPGAIVLLEDTSTCGLRLLGRSQDS